MRVDLRSETEGQLEMIVMDNCHADSDGGLGFFLHKLVFSHSINFIGNS